MDIPLGWVQGDGRAAGIKGAVADYDVESSVASTTVARSGRRLVMPRSVGEGARWEDPEEDHQQVRSWTHNRGHNFVGGHMSTGFSPNDPVFWLHHANVDRLWANWQARRLADVPGAPARRTTNRRRASCPPLDGDPAPPGHRRDEQMWPRVGGAPGFGVDIDPAVKPLLPDFSGAPAVTYGRCSRQKQSTRKATATPPRASSEPASRLATPRSSDRPEQASS